MYSPPILQSSQSPPLFFFFCFTLFFSSRPVYNRKFFKSSVAPSFAELISTKQLLVCLKLKPVHKVQSRTSFFSKPHLNSQPFSGHGLLPPSRSWVEYHTRFTSASTMAYMLFSPPTSFIPPRGISLQPSHLFSKNCESPRSLGLQNSKSYHTL